ncbi:MAG: M36 family metallopeptidase, partial [Wenzhouxiangellaceae bacterium]
IVADLGQTIDGRLFQEGGAALNRDSDLDTGVIAHEYGHGLSNRLTGGPSQASCLFGAQQAGEGWSDFLGLWVSAKADDVLDAPRGVGSYLIFQENTPGAGIRPAPYTRDMALNPLTYESVDDAGISVPHGVGTVFNSALWDMYLNLVETHGFDPDFRRGTGGNNIALRLVIEGMKNQPCGPTFLDARDGILLADQTDYNGDNQCAIWDAFARRGMGVDASDGGNSQTLNVTNGFAVPAECEQPPDLLFGDGFETS